MLLGAVLNCILDSIFIFGFGWGIKGAAWATVISEIVAAVFVMSHFLNQRHTLHFSRSWGDYCPDFKMMLAIVSIGIAPFVMMIVNSLINIIMNRSFVYYATSTSEANISIAAYGIILSIAQLFFQFMVGVSMGMQPIVGFNLGAGKIRRSIDTYKLAALVNISVAAIGFAMALFTPSLIVQAFSREGDGALVPFTTQALGIAMMAFPIIGVQITSVQFFQSLGKSGKSMFLSLTRQVVYLIPCLLIFPIFMGTKGIWISMPIADTLAGITSILMVLYQIPRLLKRYAHEPDGAKEKVLKG